jgi:hypothetical protein
LEKGKWKVEIGTYAWLWTSAAMRVRGLGQAGDVSGWKLEKGKGKVEIGDYVGLWNLAVMLVREVWATRAT